MPVDEHPDVVVTREVELRWRRGGIVLEPVFDFAREAEVVLARHRDFGDPLFGLPVDRVRGGDLPEPRCGAQRAPRRGLPRVVYREKQRLTVEVLDRRDARHVLYVAVPQTLILALFVGPGHGAHGIGSARSRDVHHRRLIVVLLTLVDASWLD